MPKVILSIPRAGSIGAMTGIVSGWAKGGALEEEEFGYCLSCCLYEPFAQGFNADIRSERNQTIMEGTPHCRLKCDNEITPAI